MKSNSNPSSAPPTQGGPSPLVETFTLGPFETNCYLVRIPDSNQCWIIDASFDPEVIIDRIGELAAVPTALILTHAHVDHIAGLNTIRAAFPKLPILIHEAEHDWLGDPLLNLSAMGGMPVTGPGPDRLLKDGDTLDLAGTTWQVLHTPGHSPGGIALVHIPSGTALVGDALFAGSIGRTDLPGGDFETLAAGIRLKLYTLPDATRILPGHGPESTIGREKRTNPFVRAER
jgi:hydroxyacylglutathione hydrolase